MNKFNFNKLTPFKWFVLENFPFIEADFDALTEWQLFCKLGKEMNKIINSENTLGTQMENVTNAFIDLQNYVNNYFDNLDVQDEINNKLNEMAQDGTLQEIIATYLNSNALFCFDTVSEMKNATNFVEGSFAKTLGFYNKNDYGASFYKIRNKIENEVIDEKTVIEINEYLVAELLIEKIMCVNQYGAKGDGVTDDSVSINKAFSNSKISEYIFAPNSIYMVKGYEDEQPQGGTNGIRETTGLVVHSNSIINLNFSKIKIITNNRQNYNAFTLKNIENVIIKNGYIEGDNATHNGVTGEWGYGISLRKAKNINLENLTISKCWGDGINLNNSTGSAGSDNENIFINNCICDDNRRQGMSIESVKNMLVQNSKFINTGYSIYTAPCSGVDIEPPNYNLCENITFNNCIFDNNRRSGLISTNSTIINHITIKNCELTNNMQGQENINDHANLSITRGQYINIENCKIGNTDKVTTLYLRTLHNGTEQEHNYFNLKNNKIINTHLLFRPINSDYVDFNFENNEFIANYDMNTYMIQNEANSGYTENNKNVNLNILNNIFKTGKDNLLLCHIYCGTFANSGVNKINIKNNEFYYSNNTLKIGTEFVADSNKFILSKRLPISILSENGENSIYIIKDNIFEYPNSKDSSLGLIEDYATNYYIYAVRNMILKDRTLNNNEIPTEPTTHEGNLRMFVYNRANSIDESNNIY